MIDTMEAELQTAQGCVILQLQPGYLQWRQQPKGGFANVVTTITQAPITRVTGAPRKSRRRLAPPTLTNRSRCRLVPPTLTNRSRRITAPPTGKERDANSRATEACPTRMLPRRRLLPTRPAPPRRGPTRKRLEPRPTSSPTALLRQPTTTTTVPRTIVCQAMKHRKRPTASTMTDKKPWPSSTCMLAWEITY